MLIQSISYRDPLAAFQIFAQDPRAAFFDSAASHEKSGRFSYIVADPFSFIEATRDGAIIDGKHVNSDPFALLEQELKKYIAVAIDAPAPFTGGAAGFLGYELGGWLERLPKPRSDTLSLPMMMIGFYDVVIAFDHQDRKAWIFSNGWPETSSNARAMRARQRVALFARKLESAPPVPPIDWQSRGEWKAELSRNEVKQRITRIIDYIKAGDIFQANFTQRFIAPKPEELDDFMLYRRLRALSPAPFASFLRVNKDLSIASASPERFLRLQANGSVEAHPIKGTRPRDKNPERDTALAQELQASGKDRAENLMIVDLMRNDLSRVCRPRSVQVPQLCALESFASVHHLTSVITGQLRDGMGPMDLLRAGFPGGSVTGAPKIRAMEIIHELEPAPRGIYCGCIGWIGFDRAMDMSMAIRTLTIAGDTVLAQAGGGIVADSDPAAEYEESMTKIAPLLRAVSGEN